MYFSVKKNLLKRNINGDEGKKKTPHLIDNAITGLLTGWQKKAW